MVDTPLDTYTHSPIEISENYYFVSSTEDFDMVNVRGVKERTFVGRLATLYRMGLSYFY